MKEAINAHISTVGELDSSFDIYSLYILLSAHPLALTFLFLFLFKSNIYDYSLDLTSFYV